MNLDEIYLNHAGTSWPKPQVVVDAVNTAMIASPSEWGRRFYQAHESIAKYFGIAKPEQLLLTPGCTSSLSAAISDTYIEPGQRVLTSYWEHHAVHRPLLKLQQRGIGVEYIPPVKSETENDFTHLLDLNWLNDELSKGDVGMVAITAACNVTGERLPYEEIIQLTNKYGSLVLIDAAQIVGWVRLNLDSLGADIVAFGGHKGLQAPWGIGGLYVSDSAKMECIAATCELPSANGEHSSKQPRPDYCDVGSVDQFALAGLHAAVEMLDGLDTDSVLATAQKQIRRIRESLIEDKNFKPVPTIELKSSMPTLAFKVDGMTSGEFAAILKKDKLIVGSGVQCAPLAHEQMGTQETGLVRVSVGINQHDEDITTAIARMLKVIDKQATQKKPRI